MSATASLAPMYRTGRGSHRHADQFCANARRAIHTGDVFPIPADEVADWAPCEVCTTPADQAAHAASADAAAAAMCPNPGVTHPQRMRSACRECGKLGAVNRSTGRIRAHRPA